MQLSYNLKCRYSARCSAGCRLFMANANNFIKIMRQPSEFHHTGEGALIIYLLFLKLFLRHAPTSRPTGDEDSSFMYYVFVGGSRISNIALALRGAVH
jgi:hypothetical protein